RPFEISRDQQDADPGPKRLPRGGERLKLVIRWQPGQPVRELNGAMQRLLPQREKVARSSAADQDGLRGPRANAMNGAELLERRLVRERQQPLAVEEAVQCGFRHGLQAAPLFLGDAWKAAKPQQGLRPWKRKRLLAVDGHHVARGLGEPGLDA